ncbi:MAG: transaldolase family protein [Lentisphaeria bacterium]|jgi:transaldolase|nr:transaldolase family protein [Lentisphaeria bacterium]MDP7741243.1 transaldolase family protein [Lentisphaeria bacterium]
MSAGYFHEVHARFGTEFWVNNPSLPEIELALAGGAAGVASNPGYIVALLKTEPEFVHAAIDEIVASAGAVVDEEKLAMQVIRHAVSRPLGIFHPLYEKTNGRYGQVAIQGSPLSNDNLGAMLDEAETFRDLGENVIIKMPATIEGAQALEELTARGWSTIGTMCFSVTQYIYMAEAYHRGLERTDKQPRCLITMLPGMFDEYLAEDAARRGVEVSPELISQAGISTARAAYKIFRERGYGAIVISGGARSTSHWTELVGRDMAVTLSGALAGTLIRESPEIVERIEAAAAPEVVEELRQTFPDFVRACDQDALVPEEFRSYGPVVRFQNSLLNGIATVIGEIQARQGK